MYIKKSLIDLFERCSWSLVGVMIFGMLSCLILPQLSELPKVKWLLLLGIWTLCGILVSVIDAKIFKQERPQVFIVILLGVVSPLTLVVTLFELVFKLLQRLVYFIEGLV